MTLIQNTLSRMILNISALSRMTLIRMILNRMTFSRMAPSRTTLTRIALSRTIKISLNRMMPSIMTLKIKTLNRMTICKNNTQQNYIQRSYTEYFNETQDNNSTQIRGPTVSQR